MAKPIVIENTGELPAHFREKLHAAVKEQYGEDVKTPTPKPRKRTFAQSRASSMALIDTALAEQQKEAKEGDKHIGPTDVLPSTKGMPPPLDPYKVEEDKAPPPPEKDLKAGAAERARIQKKQEELLGKEEAERLKEEQRKEEERRRTLLGIAQGVLDSSQETGGKVATVLSRIPTPGSLWFPLVLLLIFFFILISYNGHTRIQWAWLVLTGNASLNLGASGEVSPAQSGDTGHPTPTSQASSSSAATGSVSAAGVTMVGEPF